MSRYRKRPVVIEAVQCIYGDVIPQEQWIVEALEDGVLILDSESVYVNTLEGQMMVRSGSYIIQGVQGELYPCDEEIFLATYEEVIDE